MQVAQAIAERPRLRRRALCASSAAARCRGSRRRAPAGRLRRAPAALRSGARPSRPLLRLDQALQRPAAATVRRAATFAVQADKRSTLDLAIEHLMREAPSPCPSDDRRCRRRPARSAASSSTRPPARSVPGLRRRLPRRRARRQRRSAAAELHREELRPVRPVREHLPRTRDHARSRACCSPTAARHGGRRAS